jgi:RHS repeat-associated protein
MEALRWLFLLFTLVAVNTTHAYHFPWDQGHDTTDWGDPEQPGPDDDPNNEPCGNGTRSPVYARSGDFIWSEADVALSGRPTLGLSRTYNSRDPRVGLFGNGWLSGWEVSLFKIIGSNQQTQYIFKSANGKRYEYTYDGTNYVPPESRNDRIVENANSVELIALDGSKRVFDTSGRLISQIDRAGNTLTFAQTAGALTQVADDHGRYLQLSYGSNGYVASVTDHTGRAWQYAYDSEGNLTGVTDPLGNNRAFEYQAYTSPESGQTYQQLTRITDESGVVVIAVTYNALQVANYTEQENNYTYTRNESSRQVVKQDNQGSRWTFYYDDSGRVIRENDPLNRTRQMAYTNSRVNQTTDELNKVWKTDYDAQNRVVSEENPLGEKTTYEYEGDQPWPKKITSPSGRITQITYDAVGNPLTTTDPAGKVTTMTYNAHGDLLSLTDALGNRTDITYNAIGLPVSTTDALGQTSTLEYDARGNLTKITNPAGEATIYTYDDLDRRITTTDPLGNTTTSTYDAAGRLTRLTDAKGGAWQFEYDTYGRLVKETTPDNRVTSYQYRNDNQLTQVTRPDSTTIDYQYDAAKQITRKSVDGVAEDYTYDVRGDLLTLVYDGITYSHQYDDAGRLAQKSGGLHSPVIDFSHNTEGELTGYQFQGANIAATYAYDSRGLLTQLTSRSNNYNYQYDDIGRLTQEALPNGIDIANTFDAISQLTRIDHTVDNYHYNYDAASRITRRQGNNMDWQYGYDQNSRLTSAQNGGNSLSYQYDGLGNRTNDGASFDTFNKLLSDNTYDYTYDQRGNLTQKQDKTTGERWVYTFNERNRLSGFAHYADSAATTPDRTASYRYNPFGERIEKTVDGVTTAFWWVNGQMVAELNAAGNITQQYAYAGGYAPTRMEDANGAYNVYTDHLDTPWLLTDASGNVVWQADYGPYGQATVNEDPDGNGQAVTFNTRFPGQYFDGETGLYYNRFRYYQPEIGRYLNTDPIGLGDGINTYNYAYANPLSYYDPNGQAVCGGLCIAAIVTGGTAIAHWTRNWWNEPVKELSDVNDWTELTPSESIYHSMGPGNEGNRKFVSPNGRSEAVFNCQDKLVTDSANMGTYNYFGPRFLGGVPHGIADVIPYFIFGNTPADMFNPQRFIATYDHLVN